MNGPCLILLLPALLVGCSAPLPSASTEIRSISDSAPVLPLGPNDLLQVSVHGRPEFSSLAGFRVTSAGTIVLPIAGPVQVSGLAVEEAASAIEEAVAEYVQAPSVGLSVLEYGAHRYHVLGQVGRPGSFVMDHAVTAIEALATAQGLRQGARRTRVALLRRHGTDGVEVYTFDAATPDMRALVYLRPNDVVFVPRSGAGVFHDEVLPVLQGIGFTSTQIAALAIAQDEL